MSSGFEDTGNLMDEVLHAAEGAGGAGAWGAGGVGEVPFGEGGPQFPSEMPDFPGAERIDQTGLAGTQWDPNGPGATDSPGTGFDGGTMPESDIPGMDAQDAGGYPADVEY